MVHTVKIKGVKFNTCKFFCEKAVPLRTILKNLKTIKYDVNGGTTDRIEDHSNIKLQYDKLTGSIVEKIRAQSDVSIIKGLINFKTGGMHLGEVKEAEYLAKQKRLLKSEIALKEGWYPFVLDCSYVKAGVLLVSPFSDVFGGIPAEYSSIFESHIRGLFGDKVENISFLRMYYRGNVPQDNTSNKTHSL